MVGDKFLHSWVSTNLMVQSRIPPFNNVINAVTITKLNQYLGMSLHGGELRKYSKNKFRLFHRWVPSMNLHPHLFYVLGLEVSYSHIHPNIHPQIDLILLYFGQPNLLFLSPDACENERDT